MPISEKQMQALRDYASGYDQPDFDDFYGEAGSLAWRNRERVIDALERRGLIREGKITERGMSLVEQRTKLESRLAGRKPLTSDDFRDVGIPMLDERE